MDIPEFIGNLTPEQQLLVLCSRLTLTAGQRRLAERLMSGPLNWEELLKLSQRHLVTALFYRNLENGGLSRMMPPDIHARMRDSATRNLAGNMQKRIVLLQALDRLEGEEIKTVVLKGSALVHTIYRDESLRTFTDIDLLIPRSRLEAAKSVMESLGYRLATGIYPVADELNEEHGCEWTYVNEDGVIIEMHWDLLDRQSPFTIDPAELIERAVPFLLEGRPVQALTVEDELVHLCIHQFKHHWQRLRDLSDINEITVQTEVDWDAVLKRSRQAGADKCLLYTLTLARNVMGAPVPRQIIAQLRQGVKPGVFSGSIYDIIEKNFLSYESPHGYWPVILVDGGKEKIRIIRDNTKKQMGKARQEQLQGQAGGRRLPAIREGLGSIVGYRHLLAQLSGNLLRNTATIFGARRGKPRQGRGA